MSANESADGGGRAVALVTGASYGIGAACVRALAADGYRIAATELSSQALAETGDQIEAQGGAFEAISLDLREPDAADRAVRQALARFGRIDVLVNNAGMPLTKPALDVGHAEFMEVMGVNVAGSYFMAQAVARHLIDAARPGSIVNLASTFSQIGVPNVSAYGISKAAIAGMTRHLAVEWVEHGIRVNAVAPGAVETPIRKKAFDENPVFRQAYMKKVPMNRFGTPEEIAEAVLYLAGSRSAYVTGQVIFLDGGLTIA